jgi:MaoC like domain/N-terminal half of MaoC dehydratase
MNVKFNTRIEVVLYNIHMHLDPGFVGMRLKEHRISLSERQCTNFAAGIGDSNPIYYDDEQPTGVFVHPMLATALTWKVTGSIWDYIPESDFPTHLLMTQVHYSEYLQFHTYLRPGMRLSLQGTIAAILPHRAGTQVVICFEALDHTGEKIFTEYIGGLLRGVACDGPGVGQENLPVFPQQTEKQSGPHWIETISLSTLAPYIYDACADIYFPIHTSPRFAHQVGLPGVIVQGTQVMARALSILLQHQAGGDPRRLCILSCRFARMVIPGENLQLRVWMEQASSPNTHLFFDVQKADGEFAIRAGYCRLNEFH